MAMETLDKAVFWNDLLMARTGGLDAESDRGSPEGFPSEFPYEIDSPVESVLSSTETTKSGDDGAEEEEDFLAELTRRLTRSSITEAQKSAAPHFCRSKPEKVWNISGSPKSTLTGLGGGISRDGSPNVGSKTPSPPMTPFVTENGHPDWDMIYAAAGEVARLRLTGEEAKLQPRQQPIGAPVCPVKSHRLVPVAKSPYSVTSQYPNAQDEQMLRSCSSIWPKMVKMNLLSQQNQQVQSRIRGIEHESNNVRCGGGRPLGIPQSAWSSLQSRNAHQNQRASLKVPPLNGLGNGRRECAGTGVFLPRRYENPAPESRKRSGCSTVLLPAKVVQALNLNLDDGNVHSQQRFTCDYDILMVRRNAILAQQKRSLRPDGVPAHEVRLPQEWTY